MCLAESPRSNIGIESMDSCKIQEVKFNLYLTLWTAFLILENRGSRYRWRNNSWRQIYWNDYCPRRDIWRFVDARVSYSYVLSAVIILTMGGREIFGAILPILPYKDFESCLSFINEGCVRRRDDFPSLNIYFRSTPLVLHIFTESKKYSEMGRLISWLQR